MTSIFSDSFLGNLDRVQTRAVDAKAEKGKGTNFAEVLADLEKQSKKPNDSKNLEPAPQKVAPHTPMLSNQLPAEQHSSRARLGDSPTLLIGESLPLPTKASESVKSSDTPVKSPPLQPIVVRASTPPSAPIVISGLRVADSAPAEAVSLIPGPPRTPTGIKGVVASAGRTHGIDPALTMAIANAESNFNPAAVSKDGHHSKGVFQLLDSTGREQHGIAGLDEKYDPFDAEMNAQLGAGYLRRLMEMFGSETKLAKNISTVPAKTAEDLEKLAVAAFNAGQGRVARAQQRARAAGEDPSEFAAVEKYLPESTRTYVQKVVNAKETFATELDGRALA